MLTKRGSIDAFGNQIGVGKESDIYTVADEDRNEYALKVHRLKLFVKLCLLNIPQVPNL